MIRCTVARPTSRVGKFLFAVQALEGLEKLSRGSHVEHRAPRQSQKARLPERLHLKADSRPWAVANYPKPMTDPKLIRNCILGALLLLLLGLTLAFRTGRFLFRKPGNSSDATVYLAEQIKLGYY